MNIDFFKEKASLKHNNKYDYSKVYEICWKEKIIIICIDHGEFSQKPDNHLQGQGCPKCGLINRTSTIENFVIKANLIHNNLYNYDNANYINAKTPVLITCKKHGDFKQSPNNHLNGHGCYICNIDNFKLGVKEFINKSNLIHNSLYDYNNVNYINVKTPVLITCKKHGDFKQSPDAHQNGQGCPKCRLSKGELKILNFLIVNNINFIRQKTFDKCKLKRKLPFDFYLPDLNICIEYDGEHHFTRNEHFGGIGELKLSKIRDDIKTNYCKDNNIELIRISFNYLSKIDEILDKLFK